MNTGADLTVVVPVWKRSTNLPRLLQSVVETVPDAQVALVRSRYDADLEHLTNVPQIAWLGDVHVVTVDGPGGTRGDYAIKINAGYRWSTRPFIFTGADDIEFTPGWYDAARALIEEPTPDYCFAKGFTPISVVGTNDACNPRTFSGEHSTHTLVARWYADLGGTVDQRGVIYHEGYWHEYCDDELVQTAKMRGAYAHALDAVVAHHHPNIGAAPDDPTYQRGRVKTRHSRAHYRQRAKLWMHGTDLWAT